jgi:hypothetical protein
MPMVHHHIEGLSSRICERMAGNDILVPVDLKIRHPSLGKQIVALTKLFPSLVQYEYDYCEIHAAR